MSHHPLILGAAFAAQAALMIAAGLHMHITDPVLRGCKMTRKRLMTLLGAAVIAGLMIWGVGSCMSAATAHAAVTCEHRSAEHAASHHMSREADSRYHTLHGGLPTCGLNDKSKDAGHDEQNDGHLFPRRDHQGFHCTLHGCG